MCLLGLHCANVATCRLGPQLGQSEQGIERALTVAEQEAPHAAELKFPTQATGEQARSYSTAHRAVVAAHNPDTAATTRYRRCQGQIGRTHMRVWAGMGDAHYQAATAAVAHDQEVDHVDVACRRVPAEGAASAVAAQLADAGAAAAAEARQREHGLVDDPDGLPKEPVADQDTRPCGAAVGRNLLQVGCPSRLGPSTVQGQAPRAYAD